MQTVPAGSYLLGSDVGPPSQRPAHRVAVERFLIDETEVTNAAFAEYLNALELKVQEPFEAGELTTRQVGSETVPLLLEGRQGSGLYPLIALDDDEARIGYAEGRFRPTPGYEDHPVAETTWAGARAYCLWRGARLPSEAEWEAAARGLGTRSYPWGEALPDDARVFVSGRSGVTGAVGLRPAGRSPFGLLDMSGSLAEWTSSLARPYPYEATDGREDPTLAGERVTRGGDYIFDSEPEQLTVTHRDGFSNAPGRGHRHIGFRCARS
ncbi:MAG: SUMF1/EgtB/PvdO family nonheme iron enzyme [Pseudomonadota bacterium]